MHIGCISMTLLLSEGHKVASQLHAKICIVDDNDQHEIIPPPPYTILHMRSISIG
jgi:hypothetical protein